MDAQNLITFLEIIIFIDAIIMIFLCILQTKKGTGLGTIGGTDVELSSLGSKEIGWERIFMIATCFLIGKIIFLSILIRIIEHFS